MTTMLGVGVVLLAILACCVLYLAVVPFRDVDRARVERFARRQSLPITAGNGELVIRYLATTRRWRGGVLMLAGVVTILWSLEASASVRINGLALFAGWFVGAVIAEWRISTVPAGTRRTAALEPRGVVDYLAPPSRRVPGVAWLLLTCCELFVFAWSAARRPDSLLPISLWIVLSACAAAVILTVGRQVLVRPQRHTQPDLVAGDDAIRSRSLHVLAGSSLAIAGYLLAGIVHLATSAMSTLGDGAVWPLMAMGEVVAPLLGLMIATTTAPVVQGDRGSRLVGA